MIRSLGAQILLLIAGGLVAGLQVVSVTSSTFGSAQWYWEVLKFVVPAGLAIMALIGLLRRYFCDPTAPTKTPSD